MKRSTVPPCVVSISLCLLAGACGGGKADGPDNTRDSAADVPVDPAQIPPASSDELDAWIATQPWQTWACEPAPRGPRLNSPHDQVRVCENQLLAGALAGSGEAPVGAAAVKEMYYQGAIWSYTIAVHGKAGSGTDKWFWWRKVIDGSASPPITNQGYGEPFCSGCHAGAQAAAGHDSIFTAVPPT
jgi:hypothetical protein